MGSLTGWKSLRTALGMLLAVAVVGCGGGSDEDKAGLAAEAVPAQSVTWQAAIPANTGSAPFPYEPSPLAVDNDGTAYFFSASIDGAPVTTARAYRRPVAGAWDTGVAIGSAVNVSDGRPGVWRKYTVADMRLDDAGNAFAIYTFFDGTAPNDRDFISRVLARRRDVATGTWSPESVLGSVPGAYSELPRLVVEPGGTAWALWRERTVQGGFMHEDRYAIFVSRFVGAGWSPAERVTPDLPLSIDARIDTDKHGNPRVLIAQNSIIFMQNPTVLALHYSGRSAAGVWSPLAEIVALDWTRASLRGYEFAVDADDNALVVWTGIDGPRNVLSSRRFTPAGGWEAPEERSADLGAPSEMAFAMDSAGNAFLLFLQELTKKEDAYMVFAARFEKGRGWHAAQRISNFTGFRDHASFPRIAFDGNGNAIAAWSQVRRATSSSDVRTSIYSTSSGWGPNERISPLVGLGGTRVELAISRTGHATALWWQAGNSWSASRPASAGF